MPTVVARRVSDVASVLVLVLVPGSVPVPGSALLGRLLGTGRDDDPDGAPSLRGDGGTGARQRGGGSSIAVGVPSLRLRMTRVRRRAFRQQLFLFLLLL